MRPAKLIARPRHGRMYFVGVLRRTARDTPFDNAFGGGRRGDEGSEASDWRIWPRPASTHGAQASQAEGCTWASIKPPRGHGESANRKLSSTYQNPSWAKGSAAWLLTRRSTGLFLTLSRDIPRAAQPEPGFS